MKFNVSQEDKNKIGVYCITNHLNGKIYIGSTGNSFYNRFHQHISDYKKNKHNGILLKRAFDKYEIVNFSFSIVCICNEADRIKMEQFYIDKGVDYNCAMIAGTMLGFKHPPTSKTRTVIGGLHHTAKSVYQFNLEGIFINKYASIVEALASLGKTKNGSSHITQSCLGKTFSAFGYRWSFTTAATKRENRIGKKAVSISKGKIKKKFKSQGDAANYFNALGFPTKQGSISNAIRLNNKLYGFTIKNI